MSESSQPLLGSRKGIPASVLAGFFEQARTRPDADALVHRHGAISYGVLAKGIVGIAVGLKAAITEPGAVVGVSVADRALHLMLLMAIELSGRASASLDPRRIKSDHPAARICRYLLVDDSIEPIPDKTLIHITQDWVDEAMRGSRPVDLLDPGIRQPEAGFMARYFSTSGTTGEAKLIGITASHHSRCVYSRPNRSWVGLLEAPRFLLVYDFTAEALYRSACASLVAGGTVIFGTPTFEWMLASKANVTWMLPAELAPIVQRLPAEGTRPAPIRLVTGGSHISAALRRDLSRVAADVVDLYGSNESGEIAWRRADGAFTPYPDVEVAIIDRTGRPAPPGEAGAIAVRTDTLVAGYLGDRAEGQQNFSNGWFVTTDLGVLESDGTLRVLGRRDDLLSLSGRKVSPYPIEEAIREALGGVEVVCVDHADPGSLMTILGVAVRMPQGIDADTFRARAADLSFPDYPGPIRYRLVDSFPVTAAGKPDRRAIRRLFNTPD